jgi:AraC family cel operon transcriptional repressor
MPAPAWRLPWYHPAQPEVWAHLDRAFYPPAFRFSPHVHDYAELFLVDRGAGTHLIEAEPRALAPGELVFIHPECEHALAASATRPLVFTNISIPLVLFRDLERRFGATERWPWRLLPRAIRLDAEAQRRIAERIAELEAGGVLRDRLQVESFLLEALRLACGTRRRGPAMPPALATVLRDLADPECLRGGVSGMARRAGWSREHLNRQVRRHLGETAVTLLTRHRLDHAARLLRHGDLEVLEVCQRCGLDNLSHFYRIFRRRFGCTPGDWRDHAGPGAA